MVRGLILLLIVSEVLGRLELVPGIVYIHSLLGLTLLLIFPFSYLRHIVFVPIAVSLAVRGRRLGTVA